MTQEALDYVREDCAYDAAVDRYYENRGQDNETTDDEYQDHDYDGLDPAFSSWNDYFNYKYR